MKTWLGRWSYRSKEIAKMDATYGRHDELALRRPAAIAALLLCVLLGMTSRLCLAGGSSQSTFASPDEAGQALVSAVQQHADQSVMRILRGGAELISADNRTEGRLERERFVQKYQELHRWVRESDGTRVLYIGAENWSFPIPLVSRNGLWQFDSKGGSDEILYRRIGENEVTAISMCDMLATAEARPGTDTEADRLVETLFPGLRDAGKAIRFHGYYFSILAHSGGEFAAIAYPARYRSSGVKTFIVTRDGAISEKDLGPDTSKIAVAMTTSGIDSTWTPTDVMP